MVISQIILAYGLALKDSLEMNILLNVYRAVLMSMDSMLILARTYV